MVLVSYLNSEKVSINRHSPNQRKLNQMKIGFIGILLTKKTESNENRFSIQCLPTQVLRDFRCELGIIVEDCRIAV